MEQRNIFLSLQVASDSRRLSRARLWRADVALRHALIGQPVLAPASDQSYPLKPSVSLDVSGVFLAGKGLLNPELICHYVVVPHPHLFPLEIITLISSFFGWQVKGGSIILNSLEKSVLAGLCNSLFKYYTVHVFCNIYIQHSSKFETINGNTPHIPLYSKLIISPLNIYIASHLIRW